MALTNRVISITEEAYVPTSIDGVLNSNVLVSRLFMRDVKSWNGRQVMVPLQIAKPTTGGSFDGVGQFDTALQDTRVRQTFDSKNFYQNVSVAGVEASLNKTEGEVLNLIKLTMEEAQNAMLDSIGDQIYANGAGNDITGLGAIVDNGTNTASYAGLSRTTYPQLNSTVSAASGGALTFSAMATILRGAQAASSLKQKVTLIVTTEAVWDLAESLFTPVTNANYDAVSRGVVSTYSKPGVSYKDQDSLQGAFGFTALVWRGIPIVADEKCPTGEVYFLNENYLNWYSLKGDGLTSYNVSKSVDGVYDEYKQQYPIQWSGFVKPSNQYASIGQFIMMGNLVSGSTRRHGKLTGVTTA